MLLYTCHYFIYRISKVSIIVPLIICTTERLLLARCTCIEITLTAWQHIVDVKLSQCHCAHQNHNICTHVSQTCFIETALQWDQWQALHTMTHPVICECCTHSSNNIHSQKSSSLKLSLNNKLNLKPRWAAVRGSNNSATPIMEYNLETIGLKWDHRKTKCM